MEEIDEGKEILNEQEGSFDFYNLKIKNILTLTKMFKKILLKKKKMLFMI